MVLGNLALIYRGRGADSPKTSDPVKMMVTAYSDSDWGGCQDTRRSTTGLLVSLNDNIVQWNPFDKRQLLLAQRKLNTWHSLMLQRKLNG